MKEAPESVSRSVSCYRCGEIENSEKSMASVSSATAMLISQSRARDSSETDDGSVSAVSAHLSYGDNYYNDGIDLIRTVTPLRSDPDTVDTMQSEVPSQESSFSDIMISLPLKGGYDPAVIKNTSCSDGNTRSLSRTKNQSSYHLSNFDLDSLTENESAVRRPASSVRFHESVSVLLIPDRSEYSTELMKVLFQTKRERAVNVSRNLLEFAAEGYDWRNVTEEDDLVMDEDGQQVHPVHLVKSLASGRQAPPPMFEAAACDVQASEPPQRLHRPTPIRPKPMMLDLPRPIPQRPIHPSLLHTHPKKSTKEKSVSIHRNHRHEP
jgi:hypothetical protein